ncbi:MAG: LLM class F420-dependent oxidoreductase [Ilumatobacteraceae bacterium]
MANPHLRIGLQIPSFTIEGAEPADLFGHIADVATRAEASGFDSLWVMDHFYQLPGIGRPDENMFEAYSLLCALAARTTAIRLGAMVGGITYRNPAFLAKQITALDVISRGRAIWGIGAGWFEREHHDYGYEFGTFTDRFEKLEEGLQIVKSMFTEHATTIDGKWFTVSDAYNTPKPVQPGGPPVLIGGSGERKTLRMVAQYADACNVFGTPAQVRHLMGVLDEHCDRLGRNPRDICRTRLGTLVIGETMADAQRALSRRLGGRSFDELRPEMQARVRDQFIVGDHDTVVAAVRELLDSGLDGLIFNMADPYEPGSVEMAGVALQAAFG